MTRRLLSLRSVVVASLAAVLLSPIARAQVSADAAVMASATVQKSPPAIMLQWPANAQATGFTVYRKAPAATTWGASIASLPGSATGYTDSAVTVGASYEYWVSVGGPYYANGYVLSGIEVPLVENRGTVILIVDASVAPSLPSELARLQQDLVGDGWKVIRHDVSRTESVVNVKALIAADRAADPTNVRAVFLFGHVPVPYSGALNPDGHPDHYGAWPADVYYGELDGPWTDVTDYTSTVAGRQHNAAGDGKFDQTIMSSDVDLEVGRVDLADMPSFLPKTEIDLLRQYLNKDHAFRHKQITAQARGLIDDNFGYFYGEAFAASAWRDFSAFFGAANVSALDWFSTLATQSYLWAYGCGGGWFQGAGGVGSTSNFVSTDTQAVFTMLFGSYFGDWDTTDNFLRAPLATTTYGLTCAWSGRPHWHFHSMGLGETVGHAARITQNNTGLYAGAWGRYVHVGLMGDPTLRMHVVAPASNPSAATAGNAISLSWSASPDASAGYAIYRAVGPNGPFTRVNPTLVTGTAYTDTAVASLARGSYTYAIRAVRLETSGSGSYFNASQAVFATAVGGGAATSFHTVAPCRVVDTRRAAGALGGPSLAAGATRRFVVWGACGIPSTALSVSANVTVTAPTVAGYLSLFPSGAAMPLTSVINYPAGRTRANNAVLQLGANGDVDVFDGQSSGKVDFILDVTGYFQ